FARESTAHRGAPASFPTRRSSDLEARGWCPRAAPPRVRRVLVAADRARRAAARAAARVRAVREREADAAQGRDRDDEAAHRPVADRKSTRLNSSHVKISYAVFCLK